MIRTRWLAVLSLIVCSAAPADRSRAWEALQARIPEQKYLNHSRAVEAIMRELATKDDDKDEWGLAGLLHDIDISTTANNLVIHGTVGAKIVRELGFPKTVVHAVHAHDDRSGVARTSRLDHALYCADQVYWLMMATGIKYPSDEFNAAHPASLWEQIQQLPSKRAIVPKVTSECGAIGLSLPRTIEAAHRALRQLP